MTKDYDLVTFDIFDTLVHRKLRAPVDLFEAVRISVFQDKLSLLHHDTLSAFPLQRMQAEREAREHLAASSGGEGEVQLGEIYDRYQSLSGCGEALRDLLVATELRLEAAFLFASRPGLRLYNQMKAGAGRIAFISDMYLPSAWLAGVLRDLGFGEASEDNVFVSGEARRSKHSGALFRVVREKLGVAGEAKWLHIGDNPHADIAMAKSNGIQTLHATWASVDNRRIATGKNGSQYLIGSIVESLDQPQSGGLVPEDGYSAIGYKCFGPVVFGFVLWVMAKVRELRLQKLAFIARDGWLPLSFFDALKHDAGLGHVEQTYVHFSRQAGLLTGVKSWDVDRWWPLGGRVKRRIDDALSSVGLNSSELPHLLERSGFASGDLITDDRWGAAYKLFVDSFERILDNSQRERERCMPYFKSHFSVGMKTGIVDIGWNGNIQRYLIDSLDHLYSKEQFVGLFLGLHSTASVNRDRGMIMQGWLLDFGNPGHVQQYLQSGGVELLEFALTADHGTTLDFKTREDGSVVPVLEDLHPEEEIYRERAFKVQDGIRKFVDDFRFLIKQFEPSLLCSAAWAAPFERLVTNPTEQEIGLLADLSHSDTVGHTSSRLPLASRQDGETRRSASRLARARESAFWKVAFDRLNEG